MGLPDYLTAAELARLLKTEEADVQKQIDGGQLRCEPEGIPKSEAAAALVLEAMLPMTGFEYVDGKDETKTRLPNEVCGECGRAGDVHYTGTEVLEGSLEFVHLVHTEVEHHFRCGACGASWHQFKFL